MKKIVKRKIRDGRVKVNHHWYRPRDPWYGSPLQNGAWAWFGRYIPGDEKVITLLLFEGYDADNQPNVIGHVVFWLFWEREQ